MIVNNNRNQIIAIVIINLFKEIRVSLNNLVTKAIVLRKDQAIKAQVIKIHQIIAHKAQMKIKNKANVHCYGR